MSSFFFSDWIVVILAFINTGFVMTLNKLKENEASTSVMRVMRTIQAVLIVTTGLMVYLGGPNICRLKICN